MRPHLTGIFFVACALVGLGFAVNLLVLDIPLYFGLVFLDAPDHSHPGRLKGATVSTPELILHASVALILVGVAVSLWRRLRQYDTPG